jgi:pyrrolysine biosynthesis protein PylD
LTRLTRADVAHIPEKLEDYDTELKNKTGCNLLELAEDAAKAHKTVRKVLKKTDAAVVPVSSGGGLIMGFSQAVAATLNHIGIKTIITKGSDIVGLAEAYGEGSDLILAADDEKFVAINTRTKRVVDNATATAKAYVTALERMANGLAKKPVLVIGVGKVGSAAISNLVLRKAKPLAVDVDQEKLRDLKSRFGRRVLVSHSPVEALHKTNLILNTAPGRNIIKAGMIKENTLIASPAIPVGLTEAAIRKIGRHLIHDPLQLGVATMAVEACVN